MIARVADIYPNIPYINNMPILLGIFARFHRIIRARPQFPRFKQNKLKKSK